MTTSLTIEIYGAQSVLRGEYPKALFAEVTSYEVEGAKFSPAFRKGNWDGRVKLSSKRTGSFPTGLLPLVKAAMEEAEHEVTVIDHRVQPGRMDLFGAPSLELANGWKLRPYQERAAQAAIDSHQGILNIATGGGKSLCAAAIISALNVPSLFIVPSKELLHQTRKVFLAAIPNATEESVGCVGDDEWQVGTQVTVATMSTLYARLETEECQELLKKVDLLYIDELHLAGSDSWYEVVQNCNAYWRFAQSGTPFDRTDGGTLRLIAAFGNEIACVKYKELVDLGVLPRAKIIFDKVVTPVLPKKPKLTYQQAYKKGVVENTTLTSKVVEWTKICVAQGLSVLILVDQIEHGKIMDEALWSVDGEFISHTFIHGSSSDRESGLASFAAREIPVLIASSILDTGVSIDAIDVLICAGARKSKIKVLQRLGRALRGEKAIVVEFVNFTHQFLLSHSQQRYNDYKNEDCFILKQSAPNADLIKRLWEMP